MKKTKPVHRFSLSATGTRRKVRVYVWANREQMWDAVTRDGAKGRWGRATLVDMGSKYSNIHFSRGCLGTEVVAHESVHAACWLMRNAPKIFRHKFRGDQAGARAIEEDIAFWAGQIQRGIVSELYRAGVYS
ncbi:MAG: hypothetical protein WC935_00345 [Thermoleophilia bacterium]